jgi:hypothetical protein
LDELIDVEGNRCSAVFSLFQSYPKSRHFRFLILKQSDARRMTSLADP